VPALPASRRAPAPAAAKSTAPRPTPPATPPVAAAAATVDSETQKRAKKQILQLRKLGDAKLTKKRVFPSGSIVLEAIMPRGSMTAGDTLSVGVLVNNSSVRDLAGVRVRLEQLTLVGTSPTSHQLHESVTWRTFHEQARVPAGTSTDIVMQCTIPKQTPPTGSRQASESSIAGQPAWFTYKLVVCTDAAWLANPTVAFDVEIRAHPHAGAAIQPGKAPLGSAPTEAAASLATTAVSGRTRLTHSRRADAGAGGGAGGGGKVSLSHCVGCGDRSLARICARCFVSGRAATFCAECGTSYADKDGNDLECGKCGEPRGVLVAPAAVASSAAPAASDPARAPVPVRKAGTQIYAPKVPQLRPSSPPAVPTTPDGVDATSLTPRGMTISAPTGVQKNDDVVRAMLAAAGVDPSLVAAPKAGAPAAAPETKTMFNFSKPAGFQRNPDAVKALLEAAGVDAAALLPPSSAPPAAPAPAPRVKQLPQLPTAARAAIPAASAASPAPAAARPTVCMICQTGKVAARVARHGKELFLCRECTLEQREKFKARGTINIGASPMRKGPLPPSGPKPTAARPANNQYVDLQLMPAPTAEQLEREQQRDLEQQQRRQQAGEDAEVELAGIDVIGTCTALYDFVPEHETELGFRAGDVVQITCRVDDEWLEGLIDDGQGSVRPGLFPTSYVRINAMNA
jgi:hypothetical protein